MRFFIGFGSCLLAFVFNVSAMNEIGKNIDTSSEHVFHLVRHNKLDDLKQIPFDINIRNSDDKTLLHVAAKSSNVDMVQYLIEQGCDKLAKDKNGLTPFDIASKADNQEILEFLLSIDLF